MLNWYLQEHCSLLGYYAASSVLKLQWEITITCCVITKKSAVLSTRWQKPEIMHGIYMFQLVLFTSVKSVPTVEKEVMLLDIQTDFDYNSPSEK